MFGHLVSLLRDPLGPLPPRNTVLQFVAGARKCIGDTFAMTESTLALVTIAARWHRHTVPGTDTRSTLALVTIAARWHRHTVPGTDTRPTLAVVPQPRRLRMHATTRTPQPS